MIWLLRFDGMLILWYVLRPHPGKNQPYIFWSNLDLACSVLYAVLGKQNRVRNQSPGIGAFVVEAPRSLFLNGSTSSENDSSRTCAGAPAISFWDHFRDSLAADGAMSLPPSHSESNFPSEWSDKFSSWGYACP